IVFLEAGRVEIEGDGGHAARTCQTAEKAGVGAKVPNRAGIRFVEELHNQLLLLLQLGRGIAILLVVINPFGPLWLPEQSANGGFEVVDQSQERSPLDKVLLGHGLLARE